MNYSLSERDTTWRIAFRAMFMAGCLGMTCIADEALGQNSQSQPPSKQSKEPELTEGLLDLLKEPTPEASATVKDGRREFKPSDVGLEGEDLGEDIAHPLNSVRQSMFIAAGMLGRGTTGSETQRLQADIVQRLDELIEQLEQSPHNQNQQNSSQKESQLNQASQPSSSDQQDAGQSSERQNQERQAGRRTAREEAGATDVSQSDGEPQQPGQAGRQASGQVRLADPKALQQDVWGHLPERMRAQLQSRMVEQFLPSHRDQIEAYFRALLEQP